MKSERRRKRSCLHREKARNPPVPAMISQLYFYFSIFSRPLRQESTPPLPTCTCAANQSGALLSLTLRGYTGSLASQPTTPRPEDPSSVGPRLFHRSHLAHLLSLTSHLPSVGMRNEKKSRGFLLMPTQKKF